MIKRLLNISFYLLFFLTPLLFTSLNYELFEFNKMILVYLLTVIITGLWLLRILNEKRLIWKSTPLDIPLVLFLISQILSTVFSIDPHTSIWGYYSRSHGGLLSTISYLILYWSFVSNYLPEKGSNPQVIRFLKAGLLSGLIISVWGILEHFGHSPSCFILTGAFNDSCWVQDVQARVFATLGQPNWMAAYLEMLIFPLFYFLLTSKKLSSTLISIIFLVLFYASFTFTFSRGALLGLVGGFGVLVVSLVLLIKDRVKDALGENWKFGVEVLGLFLIVNLVFGSAVTRFKLINPQVSPAPTQAQSAGVSQLDQGGTESGEIRLIVWRGALDIFKHYPILGSGVETFAYSYYNFRPVEHNFVSEWDFLYNKAHNEYLNFLATTGLVGFLSYMLIIITFITWTIRYLLSKKQKDFSTNHYLLATTLLASYTAYLIQNFFQFSVVIIAVFFFLFPAILFSEFDSVDPWPFNKLKFHGISKSIQSLINSLTQNQITKRVSVIALILLTLIGVFNVSKLWLADTHYSKGTKYLQLGDPGQAYNELIDATDLNGSEPLYKSQLGFAASYASLALSDQDATLSASLKDRAEVETQKAISISPKNLSIWRTAFQTYYQLSSIDPADNQKALNSINTLVALAPTDPEFLYEKGIYLDQTKDTTGAEDALKKAVALKPDYRDAHFALGSVYQELNQKDQAINEFNIVLKIIPNDPDATQKLKTLQAP